MAQQSFLVKAVHAPRIVVDFGIDFFSNNIWKGLASLGICVAGITLAWIFIKLAEWITYARSSERYKHDPFTNQMLKTTKKTSQSVVRMVAMSLAILSVVIGFWIGASVVGINFFTITLSYGILAWVISTSFGVSLKSAAAFTLLAWTDKIEEEWFITVGNVSGHIVAIHILWVELETKKRDKNILTVIHVPTYLLLDSIIKRTVMLPKRSRYQV